MNKKQYYFVYGSLKEGYGNNRLLKNSTTAKFIEKAITKPIYTMYSLGGFPGVVIGGDTAIHGEIWEVSDEDTKMRLDRLEGYHGKNNPHNLYNKETIILNNKEVIIYLFNGHWSGQKVKSGIW